MSVTTLWRLIGAAACTPVYVLQQSQEDFKKQATTIPQGIFFSLLGFGFSVCSFLYGTCVHNHFFSFVWDLFNIVEIVFEHISFLDTRAMG